MKNLIFTFYIGLSLLFVSCNGNSPVPPYAYETNPQYTQGFAQFYGKYFSNYNIPDNVLEINLFSKNLGIDKSREIVGKGQYLFLEDVFVSPTDTLLPPGTYTVVDTITAIKPFTFLKGKEFKENTTTSGNPSGAFILYYEQDISKNKIKYITEGSFTVSVQNDTVYTIECNFKTNDKKDLKGTFKGVIYHFDRSKKVKARVPKQWKYS